MLGPSVVLSLVEPESVVVDAVAVASELEVSCAAVLASAVGEASSEVASTVGVPALVPASSLPDVVSRGGTHSLDIAPACSP